MAKFTYEQVKDKKVMHFQIRQVPDKNGNAKLIQETIAVLCDEEEVKERFAKIADDLEEKFHGKYFLEADELTDECKRFVFA